MPSRAEIIENLNWTTERLSNRVWTIALGVLATALAYIIEGAAADGAPFLPPAQAVAPATLALLALLFDLVQYYAANRQSLRLLMDMERDGKDSAPYTRTFLFHVRTFSYHAKIVLTVAGVAWLIVASAIRTVALL